MIDADRKFVYGPTAVYVARSPQSTRADGAHTAPADLLITDPAFRSQQAAAEGDPFAAIDESDSVEFERPGEWFVFVVSRINGELAARPHPHDRPPRPPRPAGHRRRPAAGGSAVGRR